MASFVSWVGNRNHPPPPRAAADATPTAPGEAALPPRGQATNASKVNADTTDEMEMTVASSNYDLGGLDSNSDDDSAMSDLSALGRWATNAGTATTGHTTRAQANASSC